MRSEEQSCIASCCVLPSRSAEQRGALLAEAALQSIYELFEVVPDPRTAHGLRYDLPFSTSLPGGGFVV